MTRFPSLVRLLIALNLAMGGAACPAAFVQFGTTAVTSIAEAYPSNNLGALEWFTAGATQNLNCGTPTNPLPCDNRGLFKFDPTPWIPAGSLIKSVDLRVWVVLQPPADMGEPSQDFDVHRLLVPWGEGTGANVPGLFPGELGRPVATGESSWFAREFPTNSWGLPGGAAGVDYVALASGTSYISDDPSASPFLIDTISNRLEADLQLWLDHPEQNHGWMMKVRVLSADAFWSAKRFMNPESGIADFPAVEVNYIPPPAVAFSPLVFSPQSGLFVQTVTVSNVDNSVAEPVRVLIEGLANGVVVANASGMTNGIPFVQLNRPLGPLESVTLTIEYFAPDRMQPVPTLSVRFASALPAVNPAGLPQPIQRKFPLADGSFLIDFQSLSNRTYHVQYSSNMTSWRTVSPPLRGTGSTVQWIDNGPPKTDPSPQLEPARFYRVLLAP